MRTQFISSLIILLMASACSTARVRESDPIMRIAIDSDTIDTNALVRLHHDLFKTHHFQIIDRAAGFKAIDKEQHLENETNRFEKMERYSEIRKMYGVGGIIEAHQQCQKKMRAWNSNYYLECVQSLTLINATTGEIMATGESNVEAESFSVSAKWEDTVKDLMDHYPKNFIDTDSVHQTIEYNKTLKTYREQLSQAQPVSGDSLKIEK